MSREKKSKSSGPSTADSARNTLHSWYKSAVEYVSAPQTQSTFHEEGVLTPSEFVQAGSQLVYRAPSWQWRGKGVEPSKRWSFLPDGQQYLFTRSVPCMRRVKALYGDAHKEEMVQGIEGEDDWLNAYADQVTLNDDALIADIDDMDEIGSISDHDNDDDEEKRKPSNEDSISQGMAQMKIVEHESFQEKKSMETTTEKISEINENGDDESGLDSSFEEIPDMESFDDTENVITREDLPKKSQSKDGDDKKPSKSISNGSIHKKKVIEVKGMTEKGENILKTRTYDLSITYDKYYRVPRMWLRGFDEKGIPLTSNQIMEDISADHAHKTVTVESHPHTGVVCASIHPCRHSEVMKVFMKRLSNNGKPLSVESYMFLFLKFMSAVIPTISYDYTSEASFD